MARYVRATLDHGLPSKAPCAAPDRFRIRHLLTTHKTSEPIDTGYLYAISLFGFLITLGLFIYELRGIQHCKNLEQLASRLEEQLHLRKAQFIGRRKGHLGGFVGARGAAYIIYPTVLAAWIFVAFVGFTSPVQTPPVQTTAAQATKKQL